MKPGKWIGAALAVVLLVSATGVAAAENGILTERDDKGVWFITGDASAEIYDVFEAMGYAVATDRLWQAETFRRMARGKLAEILGPEHLENDMLARITGYSDDELAAAYDDMDAETQDVIDGYVAGFNRRIQEVAADPVQQLPFEFHALTQQLGLPEPLIPEKWTFKDVLAWQAAMLRQFDPEGIGSNRRGQVNNARLLQYLTTVFGDAQGMMMFNDLRWIDDPDAPTYIPDQEMQGSYTLSGDEAGVGQVMPARGIAAGNHVNHSNIGNLDGFVREMDRMWKDREEKLRAINALPEMGSYAWVISGEKAASGKPTIYSGPQMGFDTPLIGMEGSIDAAGLRVSGMAIAGLPGIVIGRTPHHAWSMQVGHARTSDYYFEPSPGEAPEGYYSSREETITVAGQDPVTITVWRTQNGPVVNPVPFDPNTYVSDPQNPITTWKYSHWEMELHTISAFLAMTRAESMDEFGDALEDVGVSQHFCYADRDGNIAYWMSGVDPVRPDVNDDNQPVDWRLPQGMMGNAHAHWDADDRKPLSTHRNTDQEFYAGWNNKSSVDYPNAVNNMSYMFGPFHRTHVLEEYLRDNDDLTFEEIRDLALYIATTDSFAGGGNPWTFVEDDFREAVFDLDEPTADQLEALEIMDGFDGHFVAGGQEEWALGMDRADGWILADEWIKEVLRLTFLDELGDAGTEYDADEEEFKNPAVLFNVLLRTLDEKSTYDWFQNAADETAPQTAEEIVVAALDNVLTALDLDARPWGEGERDEIPFNHDMFNDPPLDMNPLHTMPFSSRSTYAHVVEMDTDGQSRIESMFALGQSGEILFSASLAPEFNDHFDSMTDVFDDFSHRDFPVMKAMDDPADDDPADDETKSSSSSTCFIQSVLSE